LRAELPRIFAETGAIFVYATTEPHEALLLGGNTATLSEGRVTQFGPTIEVFRRPNDLVTARTFADPPLNTVAARKECADFLLEGGVRLPVPAEFSAVADGPCTIGFQPHHLALDGSGPGAVPVRARVAVTEITGSESFVHLEFGSVRWVMLTHGIRNFQPGETVEVFIKSRHILVFDERGRAAARRVERAA
jgi:glycerol transport system ATP-binding protein